MTIKASDPTSGSARVFRRCLLVLICLLGFLSPAEVGSMPAPVARKERAGPLAGAVDSRLDSSRITGPRSRNETHGRRAAGVRVVGQIGGRTEAVFVNGRYAYVGVGPRVVIFDVADPAHLVIAGQSVPLDGIVENLQVVGPLAYVVDRFKLHIIDVSNPASPRKLGDYQLPYWPGEVAVRGRYAYVTAGNDHGQLHIVDVANPTRPSRVGSFSIEGAAEGVAVARGYAYVASPIYSVKGVFAGRLHIIDVRNPAAPVERGVYETEEGFVHDVAVEGGYAYLAVESSGLHVIDVHDPANPTRVGAHFVHAMAFDVRVARRADLGGRLYAYLSDYAPDGFHIIDVSDPAHPSETGYYSDPSVAHRSPLDVAVAGRFVYIVGGDLDGLYSYPGRLAVVNVSDPVHPTPAGAYEPPGTAEEVVVADARAYVFQGVDPFYETGSSGIRIIDTSDPTGLVDAGFYDTGNNPFDLAVTDNLAYVAMGEHGLRVLDVSDPAHPAELGASSSPAAAVEVAGKYAYVAAPHGLQILDVSEPAHPTAVSVYDPKAGALDVLVREGYAYLLHNTGVEIVDVSKPARPRRVGYVGYANLTFESRDLAVAGNYAFVATQLGGLRIIDVSDPARPREVSVYETSGPVYAVSVGTLDELPGRLYAYITAGGALRVIDVTDPSTPIEVGYYYTPGYGGSDVTTAGESIYVADNRGGLLVLQFTGPVALPHLRLPLLLRR